MPLSINHGGSGKDALRVGAYIRWSERINGRRGLWEVVAIKGNDCTVRNCMTEETIVRPKFKIRTADLIQEAPDKSPEELEREAFHAEMTAPIEVPDDPAEIAELNLS